MVSSFVLALAMSASAPGGPAEVVLPDGAQVVIVAKNTDDKQRFVLEAGPLRVSAPRLRVRADGRVYEIEAVPHQAFRVREAGAEDAVYSSWNFFTGRSGVHR